MSGKPILILVLALSLTALAAPAGAAGGAAACVVGAGFFTGAACGAVADLEATYGGASVYADPTVACAYGFVDGLGGGFCVPIPPFGG